MKALSIRNPWAWYILHAGKDVENRTTRWSYRGPALLHVGAGLTKDEYRAWRAAGESMRSDPEPRPKLPEYSELQRGGFVGIMRITGCSEHKQYDPDPAKNTQGWRMGSDWVATTYGYDLADATALPFVPAKGALGIYTVEPLKTPGHPNGVPTTYMAPTPYQVAFGEHTAAYLDAWRKIEGKR